MNIYKYLGWLEINEPDRAAAMLQRSIQNMLGPFGLWTEMPITAHRGGVQHLIPIVT